MTSARDTVGLLKVTRLKRGLSLSEVSHMTRIKGLYLQAIEMIDETALPARVYVLGYVRAYARYLGLPEDMMVQAYTQALCEIPQTGEVASSRRFRPKMAVIGQLQLPRGFISALALMTCMLVYMSWQSQQNGSQLPAESVFAVDEGTGLGTGMGGESADAVGLVIKALAPSWIEMRDRKTGMHHAQILLGGQIWPVPQPEDRLADFRLSVRDGGVLALYQGGRFVSLLGEKGEVMKNINLEAFLTGQEALARTGN